MPDPVGPRPSRPSRAVIPNYCLGDCSPGPNDDVPAPHPGGGGTPSFGWGPPKICTIFQVALVRGSRAAKVKNGNVMTDTRSFFGVLGVFSALRALKN